MTILQKREQPPPPLPMPIAPETAPQNIASQIVALHERQYANAAAKDREAWQWGNTGTVIREAVRECGRIVLPAPDPEGATEYFQRTLPALADLADQYRNDADDAEGYGLGTVREIEVAILALRKSVMPEQ